MSGLFVIPRKDARLAATVVVPAVIIAGGMALVCAFGHLLPGGSDLLWSGAGGVPTMAVRMQPVVPLLAIASYIVPCWCAVLVALGDASRHGDLLAAAVPVRDSSKAVSKLAAMLAVAILVCAALALAALVAANDDALFLRTQLAWMARFGPIFAVFGIASGLASVALVPRARPALALATAFPCVGIVIAIPGACALVGPWVSDPAVVPPLAHGVEASEFVAARWHAVVYGGAAASGIVLCALAWTSLPVLAGRAPPRLTLRVAVWASAAALAVSAAVAAAVNAWDSQLQSSRANGVLELHARQDARAMSDASLFEWITSWPYRTDFRRQLVYGRDPLEAVSDALRGHGSVTYDTWDLGFQKEAADRELWHRLRSPDSSTRVELERAVFDGRRDPIARLRLAERLAWGTRRGLWAEMLARADSEEDQVAITAALAWAASQRYPYDTDGTATGWPALVADAARGLRADLSMGAQAAPDHERPQIEQALAVLGRPLPGLANLMEGVATSPTRQHWLRENLDALRNGVRHSNPGAAK